MPHEYNFQLGNWQNDPGGDFIRKAGPLVIQTLQNAGLKVICCELHFDDGAAHGHVRVQGVVDGKPNLVRAMERGGILTPKEMTCDELGISRDTNPFDPEYAEILQAKLPNLYYKDPSGKTHYKSSVDTRQMTLTNYILRTKLEQLTEQLGYEIEKN